MTDWETVPLSDVLNDVKSGFACGEDPQDGVFQFRMNNVTSGGQLDLSRKRRVPRDSRNLEAFLVKPGDVLFNATNSPELVGKSAFFPGHEEPAVFSNHFLRLRPQAERLAGRYLAHWLTLQFQHRIFQGMCRQWVNQATVGRESLLGLRIPLPPLARQQRIAEALDRAEALRIKRRGALAQLDTLTQAIFLDLFGDPIRNERAWPTVQVADVCDLVRGSSPRPQGDPRYFGGPVPRLMVADITRDGWQVTPRIDSLTLEGAERSRPVPAGTVVMAVSGNVGLVSRLAIDACVHDGFVAFTQLDETRFNPAFLLALLDLSKTAHEQHKAGAIFINLTTADIKGMRLPAPPLALQDQFARGVAAVEKLRASHLASLAQMNALFAVLQHRAFRGEL